MRNSSLVKYFCAENVTGLKPVTEAMDSGGRKSEVRVPEECQMIKSYKVLEVYQEGYRLSIEEYKMTTSDISPDSYGLVRQLKRASISIPPNIAEGYGKGGSKAEFKQFCKNGLGLCKCG